jgi:hypothetical protein
MVCQPIHANKPLIKSFSKSAFIENKGQIIDQKNNPNPAALYLLNTPGMNVQLRRGGFSYDIYQRTSPPADLSKRTSPPAPLLKERGGAFDNKLSIS